MATGTYRTTLATRGLQPFLWTQFLGAFNDNLYKIIVSIYAIRGAPARRTACRSPRRCSSCRSCSSPATPASSPTSAASARVLVWTKVLEVVAMLLALPALVSGRLELLLAVLFLMAPQATFFSPAKYGIVPEMLPTREISRANGLLEMSTFVAIVLGTARGGALFDVWRDEPWLIGAASTLVVAVVGTVTSLGIPARAGRRAAAALP